MSERHKLIRERNLGQQILSLFYESKYSYRKIAEDLDIPVAAVQRFIREEKLKNYNEERLGDIVKTEDYNPLSLIDTFFESASYILTEMRFTAIIAAKFREEIAKLLTQQGMDAFGSELNKNKLNNWYANTDKLSKLADKAPKQLETYINLFTQVLDVQREVSYVKVITEILQKQDPETYKKIQKALQHDLAAKAVMDSMDSSSIVDFWANSGTPAQAKLQIENRVTEIDSEE